ncbi:hypothetical protein WJX81_007984 [Elliptochloris bilobata]|uniref:DUF4281 domain-containing protein n=1 Tax=Elliptochloris bilobata TaxID=381761 RepID=A0AAW1SJL8_9CHLO
MPIPYLPFTDAELFNGVNLVLPAWGLLLVAPRWRYTQHFVTATALAFAAFYIATIIPQLTSGGLDFGELFSYDGVVKAFSTKSVVLSAWLHYVALDLWTGNWEVVDAQKRGISHLCVVPCVALTFLFGPTGLLAYFLVRYSTGSKRKVQ